MSPMNAVGRFGTILVLGGGSDIGNAVAARLSANGGRILRTSHTITREQLHGDGTITMPFDARDCATHLARIDEIFEHHGDIDLVVLAFGILPDQGKLETEPELVVEVGAVNYTGAVSAGLHIARHLRQQGHGRMILLSSAAAVLPRRSNFVYGSSKAGLDAFGRGLNEMLVGSGASVTVVRPGFVRTKMTSGLTEPPLACTAEEVARYVARGVERGAPIVWAPPAMRWVMWALRLLPRFVVRKLDL